MSIEWSLINDQMKTLTGICGSTLSLVQTLPTKDEMKDLARLAALEAVNEHEDRCNARQSWTGVVGDVREATAKVALLTKVRNSVAPEDDNGNRRVRYWIKIVAPIVIALLSAAGIIGAQ